MRSIFSRELLLPLVLAGLMLALTFGLSPATAWAADGVLWSTDHESGNLASAWPTIWISGQADAKVSTAHSRSGRYSVALTIYNANGSASPGVRLAKTDTASTPNGLPNSAYYSAWYYFPQVVYPAQWWNVLQWKRAWQVGTTRSSDPVYTVNVGNRSDGAMYFYVYKHVGSDGRYNTSGQGTMASAPINITPGRWTQLECSYVWAFDSSGSMRCWQDGAEIWNKTGLKTEYNEQKYFDHGADSRQWTINNYSNQTNPTTQTIYIDDAAISTVRIGATNSAPSAPTNLRVE